MSRKQDRRASRAKSPPAKLSLEDSERKAREDLAGGRHREAIAGFKELLAREPRPAWRLALAEAYAGRARELAAKNMLKEALVIWENRAGLGEDIGFSSDHAALLVHMGRLESVLDLFVSGDAIPPQERDRLRTLLAAAYLAGADAVVARLPAEDPVVLHAVPARAALTAYCAGDDVGLQGALAQIPFRSPYRDWVQILKALQRIPDRPQEAADLLERVADGSSFRHLRRAAQLALLPERSFLDEIAGTGKASARFACALRGWPAARIALWEELNRLGREPRPETLVRLMYRYRDALGPAWVRRRGLRLLVGAYPASRKWLKAAGAPPPSAQETLLLAAWDAERRENPWEERERWESYARHLIALPPEEGNKADHDLRIALALRRCDHTGNILARATPAEEADGLPGLVAAQLEESLAWDPDDRDTYLRLIGYYQRGKRPKDVRRLLSKARALWPKDMQILDADLSTALESGAFKKAAGLAREMLTLDSINSSVRERLVEAHLAHARKQVVKGRPDLAAKELAQARDWARSTHARDQIDLTSGLILLHEEPGTGGAALCDLVERLGGGLAAHLTLALAGESLALSLPKMFKRIGLDMPAVSGRDDLLATLSGLRRHLDRGGRITGDLGGYLAKALAKAPWIDLPKGEMEAACDTLRRCALHKTRLSAATAALQRWEGAPLFELHAFEAKYPDRFANCSDEDLDRLEAAEGSARKEGDTRTAMRIDQILAAVDPFPFGPIPFAPTPPSGRGPSSLDAGPIALLIKTLGLEKALNTLGLPPDMKRDIKKLAREEGNEAVAHALAIFLEMISGIAGGELVPPFIGPPTRKPTEPRRGRRRGRSRGNRVQDDDLRDQLDLL